MPDVVDGSHVEAHLKHSHSTSDLCLSPRSSWNCLLWSDNAASKALISGCCQSGSHFAGRQLEKLAAMWNVFLLTEWDGSLPGVLSLTEYLIRRALTANTTAHVHSDTHWLSVQTPRMCTLANRHRQKTEFSPIGTTCLALKSTEALPTEHFNWGVMINRDNIICNAIGGHISRESLELCPLAIDFIHLHLDVKVFLLTQQFPQISLFMWCQTFIVLD